MAKKKLQVEAAAEMEAPVEQVLTVGGKPIPPEFAFAIPYEHTDQGIAEKEARKRYPATPGIEMGRGPESKRVLAMEEFEELADPYTDAINEIREPGFAYRALSPRVIKRRGMRHWQPVAGKEADGTMRVGDMILARMPQVQADRRRAYRQELGNEQLRNAQEQFIEDQEKLIREANVKGISPLRRGEELHDARDPELAASIGYQSHREKY